MKKEVYVCWHYSDTEDEKIDRLDLMLLGPNDDITSIDNLIAGYPLRETPSGSALISIEAITKMAELQNLGYKIRFFF